MSVYRAGPNNAFKPKPLRYGKGMAGKACHAFGSTTRFGLTQALGGSAKALPGTASNRNIEALVSYCRYLCH